jgi:predicted enzyme related to lactoylglutathione lyase
MAGQMVHFEVPSSDTGRALEFWGSLFGWQFQAYEGSPTEYHMTRLSEQQGGAIAEATDDSRGIRVYFDVDDIKASTARVRELGGDAGEAAPVPAMGWFAVCKDTDGNEFGLWQTDPEAPVPNM